MSSEHAIPATEEVKKHGDELEGAFSDHADHTKTNSSKPSTNNSAIPPAEDGGHARSAAAHLHEQAHLHDNKNAVQHHVPSNKLNEPPQEVSRNGKDHRRQ